MEDSQPNSNIFSLRIVSIDYYMAPPIPDIDICYSSFQGGRVNEVPVIRVYGATTAGQKTCLHVHRAFPYFYVPCSDISLNLRQQGENDMSALCLELEKALKHKGNASSKRQHVHGCSLVRARKFYGYHSSEELFVKIYLYYPHDVSRAASLLLGGAVLDKSMQPHESHIPFILQFLVDYNLYGMGHVHLSKIKFRLPVPDVFASKKFNFNSQLALKIDNSADLSTNFQADLSGREHLHSPIWISSTIPGRWMWQFSSQLGSTSEQDFCNIRRHSVCELEGDAVIDEILNQQFKTYTPLSQTNSDVKMVQSLIPIWEEEYERTGIHGVATPPDPGKPFPANVLKILSHDLEIERNFTELCGKLEGSVPLINQQSMTSSADEDNWNHTVLARYENLNGESAKCSLEKDIGGSLSRQSSIPEKEICADMDRKDACSQSLSDREPQPSQMIGSLDSKATDTEALGLLRWLATSQAAEDINSDDELVRETILSPLLPATSIDQVLEKANIDYESESQKECQDILDSIGDLIPTEELKEQGSYAVDHRHSPQTFLKKKIPQVDGLPSSPSEKNSEKEKKRKAKRHSEHHVLHSAGKNDYCKQKKSLWGLLPFSTMQEDHQPETGRSKIPNEKCVDNCRNHVAVAVSGYEEQKSSDAFTRNADKGDCETSSVMEWSVRDLMRRKRRQQVTQHDGGYVQIKEMHSKGEKGESNILLPKRLDLHMLQSDDHDKKADPSLNSGPSARNEQTACVELHVSRPIISGCSMQMTIPFTSSSESPLQGSIHTPTDISKEQDSTVSVGHWGTCKDFSSEGVNPVEAKTYNVSTFKSQPLSGNWLSNDAALSDKRWGQRDTASSSYTPASNIENELIPTKNNELKYSRSSVNSTKNIDEVPGENIVRIDMSSSASLLQHEQCSAIKKRGHTNLSFIGGLVSNVVDSEVKPLELIGMTFYKNPPVPEWKDGTSDSALVAPALSPYTSLFQEDDKGGMSGIVLDELKSFFEEDFQEKKETQSNISYNVHQEAIMGIPTHYQNDGSVLYILAPCFAPPSVGSVSRWLYCRNGDTSGELNAQSAGALLIEGSCEIDSQGTLLVNDKKDLAESDPVSCLMSSLGQADKEISQKPEMASRSTENGMQCEHTNEKMESHADLLVDMSQISGPDGKSLPTPLSQIGFRDPASVGAGQQLTLLSIEVQAESRGDLRPDPHFDATNIVALAFQHDSDSTIDICVLLRVNNLECVQRSSDGLSGCKVLVFSEEKDLFVHFVQIICLVDPDIILGWDIQGGSLGFLAERAAYLGIGLLNKVSRTPLQTNVDKREISDKKIPDSVTQEPLIADAALVEDAIIEDEWGRTHASGVHVGGRIVLNVWRLMRGEVKLNMYTVEAVSEAVLRRKIPSIPYRVLTNWFSSGPGRARHRCIGYATQRAKLNLDIINQLDMINRTSELARIFGIDFFSVLSRGSQYRVESMFLRLAHTQNYLAVSPGNQQVASQPAMECLPLVMEPESGFYADPVVVLDFQSLYPSMIIAYNLCFCTCLGNVAPSKANTLGVSSFSPDPHVLHRLKDKMLLTPNGVMYAPLEVRKGILPRLLEEILSTRIMVKQAMKNLAPSQQVLRRIFNARQLALKLIANVTYGYTAAGFSGRMPCAELADSIVQCGRSTLEKAISLVNATDKWKAKVIYGDTDSMFVLLKGRTVKEAFQIGREIASAVTAMNPNPVTLKLEKVYHPCFLLTKKRYVGYSYESEDQIEPVFDAKGIETVRRDTCGAVAKIMEQSLRLFFEHQNISEVKAYLQRQWTRILSGRVSLQDFVFAKEVRLGTYSTRSSSSLPPAAIVASKAMRTDPRAEPRYAERVPYVVIHGEPGARLVDMVVDPLELLAIDSPYRLNDLYYINKQIIPALQRVFGLVGVDLNQWFLDMPRPVREAFSKRTSYASNPQRTRIDFYYLSTHCVLCGELVHGSAHICNECLQNETAVATAVIGRTSKLEREMQHLVAICQHCGGGDWIVDRGVKCVSLACSVFYERRKVQKELQGLSAIGTDKGFYPKCMAEWF